MFTTAGIKAQSIHGLPLAGHHSRHGFEYFILVEIRHAAARIHVEIFDIADIDDAIVDIDTLKSLLSAIIHRI